MYCFHTTVQYGKVIMDIKISSVVKGVPFTFSKEIVYCTMELYHIRRRKYHTYYRSYTY